MRCLKHVFVEFQSQIIPVSGQMVSEIVLPEEINLIHVMMKVKMCAKLNSQKLT